MFIREKRKIFLISFQKHFEKNDAMIPFFSSLERLLNSSKDDKTLKKMCLSKLFSIRELQLLKGLKC